MIKRFEQWHYRNSLRRPELFNLERSLLKNQTKKASRLGHYSPNPKIVEAREHSVKLKQLKTEEDFLL